MQVVNEVAVRTRLSRYNPLVGVQLEPFFDTLHKKNNFFKTFTVLGQF